MEYHPQDSKREVMTDFDLFVEDKIFFQNTKIVLKSV